MDKAESFVFYRSFFETAQLIEDEHDRMRLYEGLIHFGLEGEKPELPYPLNAILEQMTASIKAASDRYAAAKENVAEPLPGRILRCPYRSGPESPRAD